MSPIVKFPGKFHGKLSEEDILRSIKKVELIVKTNSILIIFSEEVRWIDIERFSRNFAIYFSRKDKEEFYLSVHVLDVSKNNNGHTLKIDLSKPKEGSNRSHLLSKADGMIFVHVATDKGMEFDFEEEERR